MNRVKGKQTDITLQFRAKQPDGLLMWTGKSEMDAASDFLAIGLQNGFLVLR